jgi:flavodoxin
MNILVIYDSQYGNTEKIARAIGEVLGPAEEVEVLQAGDVKPEQLKGVELLVVGAPTQRFNPTSPVTNFLKGIPKNSLQGVKVAAFDTQLSMDDVDSSVLPKFVKIFGYAAEKIADRLEKKGGIEAMPPAGFIVKDMEGPLKDGELERAAEWAKGILAK